MKFTYALLQHKAQIYIPTPHTSLTSALSHYVRTRFLVHAFLLQDTSFSYSVCRTVLNVLLLFMSNCHLPLSHDSYSDFHFCITYHAWYCFFNKLSNYVRSHYYYSISDSATYNYVHKPMHVVV